MWHLIKIIIFIEKNKNKAEFQIISNQICARKSFLKILLEYDKKLFVNQKDFLISDFKAKIYQ